MSQICNNFLSDHDTLCVVQLRPHLSLQLLNHVTLTCVANKPSCDAALQRYCTLQRSDATHEHDLDRRKVCWGLIMVVFSYICQFEYAVNLGT